MTSSYEIRQNFIKKKIKSIFNYFGLEIKRKNSFLERYSEHIAEANSNDLNLIKKTQEISLASKSNLWSIIQSIKFIKDNNIEGDFVECGVFRGGTLALICTYIQFLNLDCKIFGYDTFEDGFLKDQLSEFDIDFKGKEINSEKFINPKNFYYNKNQVYNLIKNFNIKEKYLPTLIKGDITKTLLIDDNLPKKISFLRLDTDIYITTKIQLEILYPRLTKNGILHIDDYGICPGVKRAVDDFFKGQKIWLHKVDFTCRYLIKK